MYKLRVGDVVPTDGSVVHGAASLDESRVTGEALPQAKHTGDSVQSGSIVSSGYLHVRTEAPVSASFQACTHGRYIEPIVAHPGTPWHNTLRNL